MLFLILIRPNMHMLELINAKVSNNTNLDFYLTTLNNCTWPESVLAT